MGKACTPGRGEAKPAAGRKDLEPAYKEADDKWIPIFKQKLEVTPFPPVERAKLVAASGPIWEAWVKEQEAAGRPGKELLNFVKGEVAKYK